MLKKILIGLGILLALFFLVGFLLPGQYRVERSIVIAAERDAIYPAVADLRTWPDWTAWTRSRDPAAEWIFEGDPGKGSLMRWEGPELGQGELELIEGDVTTGVRYDMAFDDGKYVSVGGLMFEADNTGTKVVWFNEGDLGGNPINRYFGLLMDTFMGPDFEAGLAGLKERVESAPSGAAEAAEAAEAAGAAGATEATEAAETGSDT